MSSILCMSQIKITIHRWTTNLGIPLLQLKYLIICFKRSTQAYAFHEYKNITQWMDSINTCVKTKMFAFSVDGSKLESRRTHLFLDVLSLLFLRLCFFFRSSCVPINYQAKLCHSAIAALSQNKKNILEIWLTWVGVRTMKETKVMWITAPLIMAAPSILPDWGFF